MTQKLESASVKTRYEYESHGGNSYHIITVLSVDCIMPAAFLPIFTATLQDENFAFGVIKGRLTFMFRTKKDALHFQKCLRQVDTGDGNGTVSNDRIR